MNFLGLEFNIFKIKICLLLNKLKRTIKKIENILEKNSSSIYKELQFLLGLLFFIAKVIFPGQIFLWYFYDVLAKEKNIYINLSLLIITCFDRKNFSFNEIVLHY